MCVMLYIGTARELPLESSPALTVERVADSRRAVEQWFSHPRVRFVGAHTGCSCGFPSVTADVPIEYFDGMRLESDDRAADLRSVRALLALIDAAASSFEPVELYPVADGEESAAPKGVVEWHFDALDPERLFFNERFMHVVHKRRGPPDPDDER